MEACNGLCLGEAWIVPGRVGVHGRGTEVRTRRCMHQSACQDEMLRMGVHGR